jgi:phosphoribosylglycinamide formyltransferase-1
MKKRVGILISGRGSNMRALVEAARAAGYPAEIALVLSSKPDAEGLSFAREVGIATVVVDQAQAKRDGLGREAYDELLHKALTDARIEFVCLAGFMRILSDGFVAKWQGRMVNIHPSLLPAFRGLHPQKQALDAGVPVSGCTVHFVVPELDAGPVVAQAEVPVLPGDTVESLSARILEAEHRTYPDALRKALAQVS